MVSGINTKERETYSWSKRYYSITRKDSDLKYRTDEATSNYIGLHFLYITS